MTLQAIQVPDYGDAAAIKPFDVAKPAPGVGEALVRKIRVLTLGRGGGFCYFW